MKAIRFSIKAERIELPKDFNPLDIESTEVIESELLELRLGTDARSHSDKQRLLVIAHTLQEVAGEVLAGMKLITER